MKLGAGARTRGGMLPFSKSMWRMPTLMVLGIACIAVSSAGVAFAMLNDSDSVVNNLSVGDGQIEVVEDFESRVYQSGETVKKEVAVKNAGGASCFVRVLVEFEQPDAVKWATIHFTDDGTWSEVQEDGFRYYSKKLQPGETSSLVCTDVQVNDEPYRENITVSVLAESAQAFDPQTGKDYASAEEAFAALNAR